VGIVPKFERNRRGKERKKRERKTCYASIFSGNDMTGKKEGEGRNELLAIQVHTKDPGKRGGGRKGTHITFTFNDEGQKGEGNNDNIKKKREREIS